MNCVACIEIIKLCIFHFDEIPEIPSKIPHKMALNAIGKLSHACAVKKRNNWSVCGTHTYTTHSPHTHREWQSCVGVECAGMGGVATWSNMQIIAKWKCVCKVKRSATRKVSQTLFGWLWASTTLCKHTQQATAATSTATTTKTEDTNERPSFLGWGGGRGWWHQFICATHANANKLNCKSWLAASQLAPLVPLSPSPENSIKQEQQKWAIRTEPCTSTSI